MPFGLATSPDYYQAQIAHILDEMRDFTRNYLDEILVVGRRREELRQRVQRVFDRLIEKNMKVNSEKCVLESTEVKFLGHIISASGLKQDTNKVDAIRNFPEPQNMVQLQRFMGMVNYLGKFVPNL